MKITNYTTTNKKTIQEVLKTNGTITKDMLFEFGLVTLPEWDKIAKGTSAIKFNVDVLTYPSFELKIKCIMEPCTNQKY